MQSRGYGCTSSLCDLLGNLTIFKLEENNLASLYKDIPVERLYKTFRDAITVTRALGLNYLRIDALCIIQGDEKEWHQEFALMSGVYGNSTVNIAALLRRITHLAFFHKISPDYQESTFGHHQEIYISYRMETPTSEVLPKPHLQRCMGISRTISSTPHHQFHC